MPITVLLVDDEPLYAALLAQRLESRDFVAVVAADGDEALRAFAASPPDLALLDVNLPGKSGVEVLADLKQAGFSGEALILLLIVNEFPCGGLARRKRRDYVNNTLI